MRVLAMPWDGLFEAIESTQNKDVTLLSLEPNPKKQQLLLTGEAKNLQIALQYVAQLQKQPVLSQLFLQKHNVEEGDVSKTRAFYRAGQMGSFTLMANLLLQHSAWQLAKLSKQLGLIGGLGAALLLGSGLFYLSNIAALNQRINDAKSALENAPLTHEIKLNAAQSTVNNVADDIAAFKQILPQVSSLHQWLALIDQAAVKQKLILNRGDYKYSKTKQSQISDGFNLSKYEIVLPVTGQYSQIRQFIAQVLQLQPALALSDVKMTRDNTLSPNIEARLAFVLYLQSEPR